ncbi:MAG: nitrile hydratase accessory protein [Cyanobacteria bacterium]|nr:nitrile hydratase accessory protein [Cyanobacteriota bacterium]MDA0865548.1 nitrile hydratase accessory protein [Cyanobacteriota bacterium]
MSSTFPNLSSFSEPLSGGNEPTFQSPWEAKAFAMVNQLTASEHWSGSEWTDAFAQEIAAAESDPTETSTYYERWVRVCEQLLVAKGIIESGAIEQRMEALLVEQSNHA